MTGFLSRILEPSARANRGGRPRHHVLSRLLDCEHWFTYGRGWQPGWWGWQEASKECVRGRHGPRAWLRGEAAYPRDAINKVKSLVLSFRPTKACGAMPQPPCGKSQVSAGGSDWSNHPAAQGGFHSPTRPGVPPRLTTYRTPNAHPGKRTQQPTTVYITLRKRPSHVHVATRRENKQPLGVDNDLPQAALWCGSRKRIFMHAGPFTNGNARQHGV